MKAPSPVPYLFILLLAVIFVLAAAQQSRL